MFTQPCFIMKNTSEIRSKLESLGYKYIQGIIRNNEEMIFANNGYFSNNFPYNAMLIDSSIDCGTNEQLFFAIAALRDDADENQWFVMDVDVYSETNKGDWFKATDMAGGFHVGTQIEPLYCHKATVEELIEHFKDK